MDRGRWRHHGLALPDQHPQTHVAALGPFELLKFAQAICDRQRRAIGNNCVGFVGPGLAGGADQVGQKVEKMVVCHWGKYPGEGGIRVGEGPAS